MVLCSFLLFLPSFLSQALFHSFPLYLSFFLFFSFSFSSFLTSILPSFLTHGSVLLHSFILFLFSFLLSICYLLCFVLYFTIYFIMSTLMIECIPSFLPSFIPSFLPFCPFHSPFLSLVSFCLFIIEQSNSSVLHSFFPSFHLFFLSPILSFGISLFELSNDSVLLHSYQSDSHLRNISEVACSAESFFASALIGQLLMDKWKCPHSQSVQSSKWPPTWQTSAC